jgi:hypothetical protein
MQFDGGRQADLRMIEKNLARVDLRPQKRKSLEIARAAILAQRNDPWLNQMRTRMNSARKAGDQEVADRIGEQLMRVEMRR